MTLKNLSIVAVLSLFLLGGCAGEMNSGNLEIEGYRFDLPDGYQVTLHDGPDFLVHYIEPVDQDPESTYSGGVYLGNHPSSFADPNCEQKTIESMVLGQTEEWNYSVCDGDHSAEVVIDSQNDLEWQLFAHVFAYGPTEEELMKMLAVFETLEKE